MEIKENEAFTICGTTCENNIVGTWDKCCECIVEVFVSDSAREQAKLQGVNLKIFCMDCGFKFVNDMDDIKIALPTEAQLAEIQKELNCNEEQARLVYLESPAKMDALAHGVFVCEVCQQAFEKGRSDEEAMGEYRAKNPGAPDDEAAVLCDDCFHEFVIFLKAHGVKNV